MTFHSKQLDHKAYGGALRALADGLDTHGVRRILEVDNNFKLQASGAADDWRGFGLIAKRYLDMQYSLGADWATKVDNGHCLFFIYVYTEEKTKETIETMGVLYFGKKSSLIYINVLP